MFIFADGSGCSGSIHGIGNDLNASPDSGGTFLLGCIPPGTYALESINGLDISGETAPDDDWHYAQLIVPPVADWRNACMKQGSPPDYPNVAPCSGSGGNAEGSSGSPATLDADSTCAQVLATDAASQQRLVQSIYGHLTATFGDQAQTVSTIVGVLDSDCPSSPGDTVEQLLYGLGYYGT